MAMISGAGPAASGLTAGATPPILTNDQMDQDITQELQQLGFNPNEVSQYVNQLKTYQDKYYSMLQQYASSGNAPADSDPADAGMTQVYQSQLQSSFMAAAVMQQVAVAALHPSAGMSSWSAATSATSGPGALPIPGATPAPADTTKK